MDIHSVAKALETVAMFLGEDGWQQIQPLLEKAMRKRGIIGLGYVMRDGVFYQIRLNT